MQDLRSEWASFWGYAVALYGMTLRLLLRHISAVWQKTAAIVGTLALAAGYFVWVLSVIVAD